MNEGNRFSSTLAKSLFYFQNDRSSRPLLTFGQRPKTLTNHVTNAIFLEAHTVWPCVQSENDGLLLYMKAGKNGDFRKH